MVRLVFRSLLARQCALSPGVQNINHVTPPLKINHSEWHSFQCCQTDLSSNPLLPSSICVHPQVTINYAPERKGQPRTVEVTVRPFIKVVMTQPWLKPLPGAGRFAQGSWARYLEA